MTEITQENRIIDIPDLNRFKIGDHVIVDASADNDRFEGVVIGIELQRLYGSEYLVPSITLLHDGDTTDGFKPRDCRKVEPEVNEGREIKPMPSEQIAKLKAAIEKRWDEKPHYQGGDDPMGSPGCMMRAQEILALIAAVEAKTPPSPQPNVRGNDEADARRYRWLKMQSSVGDQVRVMQSTPWAQWDAAIDTAIAASTQADGQ